MRDDIDVAKIRKVIRSMQSWGYMLASMERTATAEIVQGYIRSLAEAINLDLTTGKTKPKAS